MGETKGKKTKTTETVKISVSKGYTINLGNYESTRIDASIEKNVELDKIEAEYAGLWGIVNEQLKEQYLGIQEIKSGGSN